ncbi:hypothetical protein [Salipaludibacillus sp. LMS25]|jgi:hypothetical protein|nr:hypothetical protein [Salipaludibacillus sp. LMS25]
MRKRQPNKNKALTHNQTPVESIPDHEKERPVSHNREVEKRDK